MFGPHWPNQKIINFIPKLNAFKYCLLTNTVETDLKTDSDIHPGSYRPIDLLKPPFNVKGTEVLRWACHLPGETIDIKTTILYEPYR